jgi:hypothetical protein
MDMTNGLSNDELDEIERRVAAATCAPWFSYVVGRNTEAGSNYVEQGSCESFELVGGTVEDQDFIAAAREDIPRLLEEVRRLRARIDIAETKLALDLHGSTVASYATAAIEAQGIQTHQIAPC